MFTITGVEKTLTQGLPWWAAIIMGTMTGAAGGVFRDVFINEVPLIFRKEIYALACVIGGSAYIICSWNGIDYRVSGIVCGISVILIRLLSVKYHFTLPTLKGEGEDKEKNV